MIKIDASTFGIIMIVVAGFTFVCGMAFQDAIDDHYTSHRCISHLEHTIDINALDTELIDQKIEACKLLFTEE